MQLRSLWRSVLACCLGLWTAQTALGDLSEGIVAYWPLDSDANDAVGSHDGEFVGGAQFVTDNERGKVLAVDGVDGRVEIPHHEALAFGDQDYSVATWVKFDSTPNTGWAGIVTKSRDASPWFGLWATPANQWHFVTSGDGGNRVDAGVVTDGWHHMTGVHVSAASTSALYEDGVLLKENANAVSGQTGAGDIWIGGAKSVTEFFKGWVDDTVIYDRALDPAEVTSLMTEDLLAVDPNGKVATTWGALRRFR